MTEQMVVLDVMRRESRSFLQYIREAFPWAASRDHSIRDAIARIADAEAEFITKIGRALQRSRIPVPGLGVFPTSFTGSNFLAAAALLPRLAEAQRQAIADLERDLSAVRDDEMRVLLEAFRDQKRAHLSEMEAWQLPRWRPLRKPSSRPTPSGAAPMRDVLSELATAIEQRRPCVACLLVETRGSTPQKAGSAMLVFPDGGQTGTLGGGCVEAEVRRRALLSLHNRDARPEILTFNLDDNYGWDDGLICGGRMVVLAHPLPPDSHAAADYFTRFRDRVSAGTGCTEAVAINATTGYEIGSRFLFDDRGHLLASLGGNRAEELHRHLPDLASRPKPAVHHGVAYLPIPPRVRLLIVGGGHVGQAVAQLAATVDFDIWVLDDREAYASRERFPQAARLLVGDIGRTLKQLIDHGDITPATFALIVTRGHHHDEEALFHLAPTAAGYVGMIGSRRKIKLIFEDLIAQGIRPEALQRVHAPLGVPIGSQTVPEIAISILAELIQCRNAPIARAEVRSCSP